jgi:hypothetical protein
VRASLLEVLHRGRNDENGPRLPVRWLPRLITLCLLGADAKEADVVEALFFAREGGAGKNPEGWEEEARMARGEAQRYQTAAATATSAVEAAATWLPNVPGVTEGGLRGFAVRERRRAALTEEKVERAKARLVLLEQEAAHHLQLAEQAEEAAERMEATEG